VCVTGASGKAGQAGRGRPAGAGHDVRARDLLAPGEDIGIRLVPADLTDHGQAMTLDGGQDDDGLRALNAWLTLGRRITRVATPQDPVSGTATLSVDTVARNTKVGRSLTPR
jgi:hypothetical protein